MSVFQAQYASIEDAWNMPFSPTIVNKFKNTGYQQQILQSEGTPVISSEGETATARRYINELYQNKGVKGVMQLLDPAIIRDILASHSTTPASTSWGNVTDLTQDQLMYVLLGLFALLFAIDM